MIRTGLVSGPPWRVAFIAGDGIGPEVAWASRRCAEATGVAFGWEECAAGEGARARGGAALPPAALEILGRCGLVLKAPLEGGGGVEANPNGALERLFGVHASIRHCRSFSLAGHAAPGLDLLFIRQVPGSADMPREQETGDPAAMALRAGSREVGVVYPFSPERARAFFQFAFATAARRGRRRVTVAHQASRYRLTDGAWLAVAAEVAREYPGLEWEDQLAGHVAMQMVRNPARFDVVLAAGPSADILGDVAVGLAGGLGMVPEALCGVRGTIYTAVHGTAPKYAGLNRANPVAMILTGALLLRSVGEDRAAGAIESGVGVALAAGPGTPDMTAGAPFRGTADLADAVIAGIQGSLGRLQPRA